MVLIRQGAQAGKQGLERFSIADDGLGGQPPIQVQTELSARDGNAALVLGSVDGKSTALRAGAVNIARGKEARSVRTSRRQFSLSIVTTRSRASGSTPISRIYAEPGGTRRWSKETAISAQQAPTYSERARCATGLESRERPVRLAGRTPAGGSGLCKGRDQRGSGPNPWAGGSASFILAEG